MRSTHIYMRYTILLNLGNVLISHHSTIYLLPRLPWSLAVINITGATMAAVPVGQEGTSS